MGELTEKEKFLRLAINKSMTHLHKHLKSSGASQWEALIITYHPDDVSGAWIITQTDGADLNTAKDLLAQITDDGK